MKKYEKKICNVMNNARDELMLQIRNAYDEGYEDGLKDGYEDGKADTPFTDTEEAEKKAYNRGLSDAWELVKRIESTPEDGGLTNEQIVEVFGQYWSSFELYRAFSVGEAMDLMKAYEDKQKQDAEIKVGDEVIGEFGNKGIVITNVPSPLGDVSVWFSNQTHVQLYPVKNLSKTGRHFDQIAEVLAELRGAENDE